ncbi:MAG: transcription termination/antitermination protein NusA [Candidatus Nealsonbacteria bacterium]|nr:transcription termination/antitermination protein NusA [Candidatus Nealsonbacteria bacterium]
MIDVKNFSSAIAQIAEERGIAPEKVWETIESAIAAAYKKEYGRKGQVIKAKLDQKTGKVLFWQVKKVVNEKMIYTEEELAELKEEPAQSPSDIEAGKGKVRFNPERHIMIEEAKKINSKIKIEEEVEIPLEVKEDFGRISAQTAKQVILQKIREAERETVLTEYKAKEGEIVSGIVQRIEGQNVLFDIGKTLGFLPREEQIPGEFYRPGQRLKLFIMKVEDTSKGPVIILSRAYPRLVSKLFELEVPEISQGQVQINSIAREAGSRTKIAISTNAQGIDPIGAAVGQRGTRVQAVINELGGEKIDIIEYSEDPEKYLANAMSPAKVLEIKIMPKNKALAVVQDDQLSLAIGKEGQNVRLAAKLTGWKIDVRNPEQAAEMKIEEKPAESKSIQAGKEKKVKKLKTEPAKRAKVKMKANPKGETSSPDKK